VRNGRKSTTDESPFASSSLPGFGGIMVFDKSTPGGRRSEVLRSGALRAKCPCGTQCTNCLIGANKSKTIIPPLGAFGCLSFGQIYIIYGIDSSDGRVKSSGICSPLRFGEGPGVRCVRRTLGAKRPRAKSFNSSPPPSIPRSPAAGDRTPSPLLPALPGETGFPSRHRRPPLDSPPGSAADAPETASR
jgi:hypothetical protein